MASIAIRNGGKRPLNADEPVVEIMIPDCPTELGPVAKAEWERLASTLVSLRLLTPLDRATLAAYCGAYELWAEAATAIQTYGSMVKSPTGFPMQSPYIAIANRQAEIMLRVASELASPPQAGHALPRRCRGRGDLFDV